MGLVSSECHLLRNTEEMTTAPDTSHCAAGDILKCLVYGKTNYILCSYLLPAAYTNNPTCTTVTPLWLTSVAFSLTGRLGKAFLNASNSWTRPILKKASPNTALMSLAFLFCLYSANTAGARGVNCSLALLRKCGAEAATWEGCWSGIGSLEGCSTHRKSVCTACKRQTNSHPSEVFSFSVLNMLVTRVFVVGRR